MNFAWRLSAELPRLLLLRLRLFLCPLEDWELESKLELLLGLSLGLRLGSDLDWWPPLRPDFILVLPARFFGLDSPLSLLLPLTLLLCSSLLSDVFLFCLDLDLPRERLEIELDLLGLGSRLPEMLLDPGVVVLLALDLDLDLLLVVLLLVSLFSWVSSRLALAPLPRAGLGTLSLLVASWQAASKSSVSGGGSLISTKAE
jgi:hypothetical protein